MTTPFLVPCLIVLRSEFNLEAPNRDKGADGWIGDAAHQSRTSDHNPDSQGRVLAVDIDTTGPWPTGYSLDLYVSTIVSRCQAGDENRLEYIIRNRKIYERKNGYEARDYTGDDPHTNHAHFSARHDHTGQNDRSEWIMLSATDKAWITTLVGKIPADTVQEFKDTQVTDSRDVTDSRSIVSAIVYGPAEAAGGNFDPKINPPK